MSTGNNFFDDVADTFTQFVTGGLVGYDKNGKLKAGIIGDPAVKGTKELTGAAAAEEANKLAQQQYEEQKATLAEQRQNTITQNKNNQITASNASTANQTKATSTASGVVNTYNTPGQTDFLGL